MPYPHSQRCARHGSDSKGLSHASIRRLRDYLQDRGYAATTITQYLAVAERFHAWRCHSRAGSQPLGAASVMAFIRHCRATYHLHHVHHLRSGVMHLAHMLEASGELAGAPSTPPTYIDLALGEYLAHLRGTCGLAESTCQGHAFYARQFLHRKYGMGRLRYERLCPQDCTRFIADVAKRMSPISLRRVTSSIRTYLRYLQMQGQCGREMIAAIPTIPMWKLAHLPRTMTKEQLRTFLACFDRTTVLGRRDYAMALLMSKLGLRVSEVAQIQLDDIHWRDAAIRLASPKSRRAKVLPLPTHVGRAIADYLRHGRPPTSHRHVFARHGAPRGLPVTTGLIRAAMIRAYKCCGFDPAWKGTHILRHTVATHLYQSGATLKDVADLLGHRSLEASLIYTKVNLPALAAVAMPWPEVTL